MTFVPPIERAPLRAVHKRITKLAGRGLYAKAELALMKAPDEYQAAIALCRYICRLRYAGLTDVQAQLKDALERNGHSGRIKASEVQHEAR